MKLLIKQRVFSWTDTYDVYDENGTPKYFVKGEFLSIGHKIHIYRHDTGEEVGMVREKLMTVMPRFELITGGRVLGSIQKRFALFKPKYEIDYNDWRVEGTFWNGTMMSIRNAVPSCISGRSLSIGVTRM
ncbi:MAG: LURP-one-related/scramblase family protein [Blautia marasmi]